MIEKIKRHKMLFSYKELLKRVKKVCEDKDNNKDSYTVNATPGVDVTYTVDNYTNVAEIQGAEIDQTNADSQEYVNAIDAIGNVAETLENAGYDVDLEPDDKT